MNSQTKFEASGKVEILAEAEISLPDRFRQMARLHPARMALAGGAWQPIYAELDAVTNRLANILISAGGKIGDRAALLMRHDAPLIAAALAVLKAGRVVVVLNPNDPPERLKQVLADAGAACIIADLSNNNLARQIAQTNQEVICFEKQIPAPAHSPKIKIAPTDIAWLIYTSGSSGRPKGVMQTHRNIVRRGLSRGLEVTAQDRIISLGFPSGGQGVSTIWLALLNGAALFPFPIAEKGVIGLKKWMLENKITVYGSSASLFRSFAKTLDDADFFPDVRLVRFASEPATANDFITFKKHFSDKCVLLNSLSSSETGNIAQQRFTQNENILEGRLPVGWPARGMEIFLWDENGREVREGETGEIIIRSSYLSPGYWRNESLTAERFFQNADGVRIFRSGDRARRTSSGSLVFMDRKDARVKIHGYRVELSEIEVALMRQPEVENVFISTRTLPGGEAQVVAYVVARATGGCTAETLRRELNRTLPGHMVPGHFIFLEKFPLTPHGKIDREKLGQILPAPAANPLVEAPATETERLLVGIWEKIFNRGSIGRRDNFFDLGGDSLNAVVVAAQIHAALGVELELRAFADHSILMDLARIIDDLPRVNGPGHPGLVRAARDTPLPLSFAQERVWKHSQTVAGSFGYTMASSHRLCGPLNVNVLRESMNYLISRHEILRTTFDNFTGRPAQIIHPAQPVSLSLLDFSGDPEGENKTARLFREKARQVFDLKKLPLLHFVLVRLREDEHQLLQINHHIISDAWSWKIYFRELALVYEAKSRGQIPSLPEFEPLQYGDYAAQQRRVWHLESAAYQQTIEWWSSRFADARQPMKLPFRRLWRSRRAKPADGLIWWGLSPDISRRLDEIGRKINATYYMIRLAAFVALLSADCGNGEIILGTYVTGRNRVELQNMIGDFVNLATLRLRCDHAQTFREWLATVRTIIGQTQAHSEIPYERLCEELRKRGVNLPKTPVIFSVSEHTAPVRFAGLELTWLDRHIENMPWGFCMAFDQHHEQDRCRLAFDARRYSPRRVKNWLGRFVRLLDAVSVNPDLTLGKLLAMSK